MSSKYFLILLVISAMVSCSKKDGSDNGKYVASVSKIINMANADFSNVEPQLKNKAGYRYEIAPPNVSMYHKAEVHLPAIDDSSRSEAGKVYLHIALNNTVDNVSYYTDPISQSAAFAMMLNINSEALKTPTGLTPWSGNYIENNSGGPISVESVLQKVRSGQAYDQLWLTYKVNGRGTTLLLSLLKVAGGLYEFSYDCSP